MHEILALVDQVFYIHFGIVVVPEASKELLSTLPGVKTVEVTAKYPIAEGGY